MNVNTRLLFDTVKRVITEVNPEYDYPRDRFFPTGRISIQGSEIFLITPIPRTEVNYQIFFYVVKDKVVNTSGTLIIYLKTPQIVYVLSNAADLAKVIQGDTIKCEPHIVGVKYKPTPPPFDLLQQTHPRLLGLMILLGPDPFKLENLEKKIATEVCNIHRETYGVIPGSTPEFFQNLGDIILTPRIDSGAEDPDPIVTYFLNNQKFRTRLSKFAKPLLEIAKRNPDIRILNDHSYIRTCSKYTVVSALFRHPNGKIIDAHQEITRDEMSLILPKGINEKETNDRELNNLLHQMYEEATLLP